MTGEQLDLITKTFPFLAELGPGELKKQISGSRLLVEANDNRYPLIADYP